VLIPIIKLSTSPNVLSKEFRPSLFLLVTCWALTLIVIGFDIYLFVKHAINLWAAILIGITGSVYLLFLVYLVWKPLEINGKPTSTEDGWMSLPQHDDSLESPQSSRQAKFDEDAEEIYAL
jgi:glucose-6-phosphate-specific signal transduction histidine kinase